MGRPIERLERLLDPDELVQWRFHGTPLFVTSAARVTGVLMDAALRGETIYDPMPIRKSSAQVSRETASIGVREIDELLEQAMRSP